MMPPIPTEILTVWLAAFAHLVVLGVAIFGLVGAAKHSAHALHWRCLDGAPGQVALRWGPIVAGAALGPAIFPGLPVAVAVLLGTIAGAQSRGLYRAARRFGGARLDALLVTSEHRDRAGDPPAQGGGPWEGPWASMLVIPAVPGLDVETAKGTGVLLVVGAIVVAVVSLLRLLRAPVPPPTTNRTAGEIAHQGEVRAKEATHEAQAAAAARVDAVDAVEDPHGKHVAILDEYERRHGGGR